MVTRIDIKSCWRVIATVVLNGETLQTAQRVATYPNTNTDTGRYEKNRPRTHAKRLNRDSVVLGVGKPSNAQRGGRSGETRLKSDSPNWSRILEVTSNLT